MEKCKTNYSAKQIGLIAEQQAYDFLLTQGLILRQRNFSCRWGEIDLIMRDKQSLVFVEVRYRYNTNFGSAQESVRLAKQKKLSKTAQIYLQQHHLSIHTPCRFDIIAITHTLEKPQINWFKNAF